jgi:subtilisin family serine protease
MKVLIALITYLATQMAGATTVAVIDSGIDVQHRDLKKYLWVNPGESGIDKQGRSKSQNNIDDDRNGFVDDIHGWDFVLNQPAKVDPLGHGTHVAGLIASADVKIMSLRYYSQTQDGDSNLRKSVQALHYAIEMGADIINYSGGGPASDPQEREALLLAAKKNILVVAAAGNESRELASVGFYPATYGFSNILSVTSVDGEDNLSRHSNFGIQNVHLAATGESIKSTLPGNRTGTMSGTSQATAVASGLAGKLMHKYPHLKERPQQVILRLMNMGLWTPQLFGLTKSSSVLKPQADLPRELGSDVDAFGDAFRPLAL